MKVVNGKNWKTLLLLSIIVPVSLLATFKLTGIIQSPEVKETAELPTVTWNMTRLPPRWKWNSTYPPYDLRQGFNINETVMNIFNQGFVKTNFTVWLLHYSEDDSQYGGDRIDILIEVQAEIEHGFIQFVEIKFSQIDDEAFLDIDESTDWTIASNLKIDVIRDSFKTFNPYVHAYGLDRAGNCSLKTRFWWVLLDFNTIDHHMTITMEITYFNGTANNKTILPIQLDVLIQ